MAIGNVLREVIIGLGFGKPDLKPLDEAEQASEKSAKKSAKSWDDAGKAIGGAFKAIALEVVGGTAAVTAFTKAITASADASAKAARSYGTTAEIFQEFEYAAARGGTNAEAFGQTLRFIDEQMLKAASGGAPEFTQFVELIGTNLEHLSEIDARDRIGLFADKLNEIEDGSLRSAVAMKLLGPEAGKLRSALAGGSEGLRQAAQKAHELGAVLDDETLTAIEAFQDSTDDSILLMKNFSRDIAISMIPTLEKVNGKLQDVASSNKEMVQSLASGALDTFADSIELVLPILSNLAETGQDVVSAISDADDKIGQMLPTLALLGTAAYAAAGPWGVLAAAILTAAANLDKFLEAVDSSEEFNKMLGVYGKRVGTRGAPEFLGERAKRERKEALSGESIEFLRHFSQTASTPEAREAAAELLAEKEKEAADKAAAADRERFIRERLEEQKRKAKAAEIQAVAQAAREAAAMREAQKLFGAEVEAIAGRSDVGLGSQAVRKALEAAAGSLAGGANTRVARQAAYSQLSSLSGTKLDPNDNMESLSDIFGSEVSDAKLSTLAAGASPQVLNVHIINNFKFDNRYNINETRHARATGQEVAASQRDSFQGALDASTTLFKLRWRR